MTVIENPLLLRKKAVSDEFQIERSLRFTPGDTTSLKKSLNSSNRRVWTWSGWVKRSGLGSAESLFTTHASSDNAGYINFYFNSDKLQISGWSVVYLTTNRLFRDTSAWYHIVCAVDTTNAVEADRVKFFVNGVRETSFATENQPAQNTEFPINSNTNHGIATNISYTNATHKFNGYLADVHFIDGLALSPAAFGYFDANTNVWTPKAFAIPNPNDGRTWSSDTTGLTNADRAFNGNTAIGSATASSGSTQVDIEFDPPLTNVVEFEHNSANGGVHVWAFNDGELVEDEGGSASLGNWRTPPSEMKIPSTINSFQVRYGPADTNANISLAGIKVNGVVLVDGLTDPTTRTNPNNGTTWSNLITCTGGYDAATTLAFNGSLSDGCKPDDNETATFTPSSAISCSVVELHFSISGSSAAGSDVTVNGTDKGTSINAGWNTISGLSSLTALTWKHRSGVIGFTLNAVRIDGHTLVDGADDNSCHLKFNDTSSNAAIGTDSFSNGNWTVNNISTSTNKIYSTDTSGGSVNGSYPMTQSFDGRTNSAGVRAVSGGGFVFQPSSAISYSSKIEVHSGVSGVGTQQCKINDGTAVDVAENTWVTVKSGSGTLTKLEMTAGSTGNANIYLGAVRVDGTILTDAAFGDVFVDSPMNYGEDTGAGGEVRGNYATLNTLNKHNSADVCSQGNLSFTTSSGGGISESTIAISSGKFYYEAEFSASGDGQFAGIRKAGGKNYDDSYIYVGTANKYTNGGSAASYGATLANGDIIGTAFDADNGTLTFYKNGASQGTAFTGISTANFPYAFVTGSFGSSPTYSVNFGQRPFKHAAPSGFKALCTQNLDDTFSGAAEGTVNNPSKFFDAKLYEGTGSSLSVDQINFAPDLLWIKSRSDENHNWMVYDRIRGNNYIMLNSEDDNHSTGTLNTSLDSDGYTISTNSNYNTNDDDYVSYVWDAGTAASGANNDGTINIASGDQWVNTTAGFSITQFTSTGSSGATVGHGLNVAPEFMIIKSTGANGAWGVYHKGIGLPATTDGGLVLNTNAQKNTASDWWASTNPTNDVFSLGNKDTVNPSSTTMICYAWTPIAGYSSFGTYTGNGNADGPFVYTGFRPRFVLVKNTSNGGNWNLFDSARSTYSPTGHLLLPNDDDDESTESPYNDFLSNGFKLRTNDSGQTGSNANQSSDVYVYAAFAESPLKIARAR